MLNQSKNNRPQAKSSGGNTRKPDIRDDMDSRKNEEYKSKGKMKQAEVQDKKKEKETKAEE
jgi:hypothetical protein